METNTNTHTGHTCTELCNYCNVNTPNTLEMLPMKNFEQAFMYAIRMGGSVSMDSSYKTIIDAGYVATFGPNEHYMLVRQATWYVWQRLA